jgi:hypothetical protein
LHKRLLPWTIANKKPMMKHFDNALAVKNVVMSWRNLQPERGKGTILTSKVPLSTNTKLHELERFRTFLEFARNNGWLTTNFAKAPHIKLDGARVQPKYGFRTDEWDNIKTTLKNWRDRYLATGRKERLTAYVYAARFLGQRLSDLAMLGPHSIVEDGGKFFIALSKSKRVPMSRFPSTPTSW